MRAELGRILPAVEALAGTAESIPLPDSNVDAVTCAQAFHWFDADSALREMWRVLRPGGGVGLVWNLRDDSAPVQRGVDGDRRRERPGLERRAVLPGGTGALRSSSVMSVGIPAFTSSCCRGRSSLHGLRR